MRTSALRPDPANNVSRRTVSVRRSIVKAATYRIVVMSCDFSALYLMTNAVKIAVAFTLASNAYTTAAYVLHERIWSRIGWGLR